MKRQRVAIMLAASVASTMMLALGAGAAQALRNPDVVPTQAAPSARAAADGNPISFVAGSMRSAKVRAPRITVPGLVQPGDTLLLTASMNNTTSATPPSGWHLVGTRSYRKSLGTRIWTRTAKASDASSTVRVTMRSVHRSTLTLTAYRGVDPAQRVTARASVDAHTRRHTTPSVTVPAGAQVVYFWSEKGLSTTSWKTPPSDRRRAVDYSIGPCRISAAVADASAPGPGVVSGSTATTNAKLVRSRGVNWSMVLAPAEVGASGPEPTTTPAPTVPPDPTAAPTPTVPPDPTTTPTPTVPPDPTTTPTPTVPPTPTGLPTPTVPPGPPDPPTPNIDTMLQMDLRGVPDGPISVANFDKALPGAKGGAGTFVNTAVGTDGTGRFIRQTLKAGTFGGAKGIVIGIPMPRQVNEATIQYSLRFPANFDWSLGGKLPGLSGVAPGTSWSLPAGGQPDPDHSGWSSRLMWLGPKAYSHVGAKPNEIASYVYHPGQSNIYGDNEWWNNAAPAGTKVAVTQHIVMNTPGRANGVLEAWFGQTKVIDRHDYVFRTRSDVAISWLMWSIFRGGNDAAWAGDRDGYVDVYDDLKVTTPLIAKGSAVSANRSADLLRGSARSAVPTDVVDNPSLTAAVAAVDTDGLA